VCTHLTPLAVVSSFSFSVLTTGEFSKLLVIVDSAQLIGIVQEYEELYNLRHSDYSNQQRRDNVWEETGRRMNQLGKYFYNLLMYTLHYSGLLLMK
jgi:hypothetical protein